MARRYCSGRGGSQRSSLQHCMGLACSLANPVRRTCTSSTRAGQPSGGDTPAQFAMQAIEIRAAKLRVFLRVALCCFQPLRRPCAKPDRPTQRVGNRRPAGATSEGAAASLVPCCYLGPRPPKAQPSVHGWLSSAPAGCSLQLSAKLAGAWRHDKQQQAGQRRRKTIMGQCPGSHTYFPVPVASPTTCVAPESAARLPSRLELRSPVRRGSLPTSLSSLVAPEHEGGSHRQQQQAPGHLPTHLGAPKPPAAANGAVLSLPPWFPRHREAAASMVSTSAPSKPAPLHAASKASMDGAELPDEPSLIRLRCSMKGRFQQV